MSTVSDSPTPAGSSAGGVLRRVPRLVWLAGSLLVLGGCVEPAYYGGTPYYEERNAYYESRPTYVRPGYYGGNTYYGNSYYRPAPRVDVYYYDRGRRDDYRRHDDYRRYDDHRNSGRDGRGRRDEDRDRHHGRDDRRSDPPVSRSTPPSPSGSGRREVQWSSPQPGTPEADRKNGWVPRPHY